jgi:hypothetical protein
MAFDPDKYLQEKLSSEGSGGFDPDAYLKAKGVQTDEPSSLEALLRGIGSGLTFGAAPAIGAAIQHPIEAFKEATNPLARLAGAKEASPEETKDFDKEREVSNNAFEAAQKAHPWVYGGGNVLGSLPAMALAPETAPGIIGGAKLGAGLGALSGVGSALSQGKDVGGIAQSTALQGVIGGGVGGIAGGITSKLNPNALEESANSNTFEAFNPTKGEVTKVRNIPGLPNDVDGIQWVGANALKPTEFLDGKAILQKGANPQELLDNVQTVLKNSGAFIGDVANKADESGVKLVDPSTLFDKIQELIQPYQVKPTIGVDVGDALPSTQEDFNLLNNMRSSIKQIIGDNPGPIDFTTASRILKLIDSKSYNQNGIINQDMNELRGALNENIEKSLEQVASMTDNPELFSKFKEAKDMYRTAKLLDKSANNSVSKDITNADLGVLDYAAGAAGAHALGGPAAIAAVVAKKALTKNYNSYAAVTQKWTADTMKDVSSRITAMTPEQFKSVGAKMATSDSPTVQSLGRIYSGIADRDNTGRNAMIFSLLQIPQYRDIMRDL